MGQSLEPLTEAIGHLVAITSRYYVSFILHVFPPGGGIGRGTIEQCRQYSEPRVHSWLHHIIWWRKEKSANTPFPLTSKYVRNSWRHVWGASKRLLRQFLHCYIQERRLRSDGYCFVYRGNMHGTVWTPMQCSSIGVSPDVTSRILHSERWWRQNLP